jgi:hypothetical protein
MPDLFDVIDLTVDIPEHGLQAGMQRARGDKGLACTSPTSICRGLESGNRRSGTDC